MDDSGKGTVTSDVLEEVASVGSQTVKQLGQEVKEIPGQIVGQLTAKPKVQDQKAAELEAKKAQKQVEEQKQIQSIVSELEAEMTKLRAQRETQEKQYHQTPPTTSQPAPQIKGGEIAKELPQVSKARIEKNRDFRGD